MSDERPVPVPLARIALRNTVWVSLGSYATQVLGAAALIVLTRLLAQDAFGAFALATFWFGLFNLRTKAGLTTAAIQELNTDGALLGTYLVIDVTLAALSLLLAGAGAVILAALQFYPHPVLYGFIGLMAADSLTCLATNQAMALEKEFQLSRLTLANLLAAVLSYGTAITLAFSGAGWWSLLSIPLVANASNVLAALWLCRRRLPYLARERWRYDRRLAGRLLRRGLTIGVSIAFLSVIAAQFDNFLIGTFVDIETLGYYDRAYRIAQWPNLLVTVIVARIGYLTFVKVREDRARLTRAVRLALWMLLTCGLPLSLTLAFGASDVVLWLYGPRWAGSIAFLQFLSLSSILWAMSTVGLWLAIAKDHQRVALVLSAIPAGLLIAAGTPLTVYWGTTGTLVAVGVMMVVGLALSLRYLSLQIALPILPTFLPHVGASLLTVGLLALISMSSQGEQGPSLLRLAGMAGLALFGYVGCLFLTQRAQTLETIRYLRTAWTGAPGLDT